MVENFASMVYLLLFQMLYIVGLTIYCNSHGCIFQGRKRFFSYFNCCVKAWNFSCRTPTQQLDIYLYRIRNQILFWYFCGLHMYLNLVCCISYITFCFFLMGIGTVINCSLLPSSHQWPHASNIGWSLGAINFLVVWYCLERNLFFFFSFDFSKFEDK